MKAIPLLLAITLSAGLTSCKWFKKEGSLPKCIKQKAEDDKCITEVTKFTYDSEVVYVFSTDCPDKYVAVYDDKCEYVCASSGGLTGKGDGLCADFYETAKEEKVVWKRD